MQGILKPRWVAAFLGSIVALLMGAHLLAQVYYRLYFPDHSDGALWLINLFNVDSEHSLPTLYSYTALLFTALLLWVIGMGREQMRQPYHRHWKLLSLIFLFLALDEALVIHERLITPSISWVTPYLLLCLLFLYHFWGFIQHLPPATRNRFVVAGGIFIIGAVGMEIPGGQYYHRYGSDLFYLGMVTVEELLEMGGIVLFIYALCDYLDQNLPTLILQTGCGLMQQRDA